jgi:hypothetical protein
MAQDMKKGSRHSIQSRLKMSKSIKQVRDKIIARHLGAQQVIAETVEEILS